MEIKKIFRNFLLFLVFAAVAVFPILLYIFLLKGGTEDALMYSGGSLLPVAFLSVLGAVAVWLTLKRPLCKKDEEAEEEFEEYEEDAFTEESKESEELEFAREEYPELFIKKEAAEEKSDAPSYYEALTKAISSQKAEYVPETAEEKDELDEIFTIKKVEEEKISDLYDLVPDTLPEGYTVREEENEEDNDDEELQEEAPVTKKRYAVGETVASKIAVFLITIVLLTAFSVLLSQSFTVYSSDGVSVHSFGKEKSYKWDDCKAYEISPSFFGDRLSVTLYMNDGEKIELLPSDISLSEEFAEKYGTVYSYALHVSEKLEDLGVSKSVKERNTIEGEFFSREDIGEDIKKLLE